MFKATMKSVINPEHCSLSGQGNKTSGPTMTAPGIRASPRMPIADHFIVYYAAVNRTTVKENHDPKPHSQSAPKTTVTALACECETSYTPTSSRRRHSNTAAAQMKLQKQGMGSISPSARNNPSKFVELPRLAMRNAAERERTGSLPSSPAGSECENYSCPSSRASTHQTEATDSVITLLTPTKPTKGSRLREVNLASDQVDTPNQTPKERPPQYPGNDGAPAYPSLAKTVLIMISLYISIFLVALDRTIIGPAIPSITNQFDSLKDVGWYASVYLLTSCGFILLYGRIYTFFPTKPAFLCGILLFEIGSAICGAAQSSIALIVGRAIAGLGSSGVFTGAILIMLNIVPLHKRPLLQGLFGACFGVASVTGPLLGGAFTESGLTWRWCFYINIPLGAVTVLVIMFMLKLQEKKPPTKGWKDTVRRMDPLGTLLFLPSIVALLLALEWGAAEYAWNSPRLIALLAIFAVLFIAFIVWQYLTRKTTATIPARIVSQRSIACGCASQFCVGATMLTVSIYMPLWFQAIKGVSPFQSGANSLPLVLATVVASVVSGGLIQRIGYYTPFMIIGACCMAVGTGLITTLAIDTENAKWIGYLIVLGIGVGFSMQHANLAVQVILEKRDVPIGTAMLSFCQTLGGAVFTAVGQNLYIDKFSDGLQRIEGINVGHVLESGATDLTRSVAPELRNRVLEAYNHSLTQGTFLAVLFVACLAVPAALGMEWRSVKTGLSKAHPKAIQDVEMSSGSKSDPDKRTSSERRASRKHAIKLDDSVITQPAPAWKKMYRSSGQFSQWMTAKVNPDLRSELESAR